MPHSRTCERRAETAKKCIIFIDKKKTIKPAIYIHFSYI